MADSDGDETIDAKVVSTDTDRDGTADGMLGVLNQASGTGSGSGSAV